MSAMKSLLLHLDPSPRSAMRVTVARELAARHDATVTAMFALPLLQRAKQVHVAGWDSEPRDLEHLFYHHGIDAVFHREGKAPAHVGEYMLSRAAELGADLLVMGCYGHSRARELVLGGASRTVLDSMTLPVLMVH